MARRLTPPRRRLLPGVVGKRRRDARASFIQKAFGRTCAPLYRSRPSGRFWLSPREPRVEAPHFCVVPRRDQGLSLDQTPTPALTLRAWPRPLDCKATIRAPNDHALDASELVDMGDDPFSEMSPWNTSHEHSCRGHVFNFARMVAAAFQDVISGSRQRDSFASTTVLSFSCQSRAPSRRRA
jgi:hypothetical protein